MRHIGLIVFFAASLAVQNLAAITATKEYVDRKDAATLQAVDQHIKGATNPHKVTAEQVGAYTKKETDSQISNAIGNIQFPVPYVPTKVSELDNDAGYVTDSVTNGLISKEYVDRKDAATLSAATNTLSAAAAAALTKAENAQSAANAAQTAANAASDKADAANAALANKLDKTAVVEPSASAAGKAADAKAVNDALNNRVSKIEGEVEHSLTVKDGDFQAILTVNAITHGQIGDDVTIKLPKKSGSFALTSDIEDAVKNPSAWKTESAIKWQSDGTAIKVSVAASGALSADLTGWTDGQAQIARITIASGASISDSVQFVGYGYWPTDQEFVAVCIRVGSSIYVNVITGVN